MPDRSKKQNLENLLNIMQRLRDSRYGCPWDLEQSYETIAPYTLEEAYEVNDAIYRRDFDSLREELGDLLFQIIFLAQLASEDGLWGFVDVVEGICEKMIRRHPHVFGDEVVSTAADQEEAWERHKTRERDQKREERSHRLKDKQVQHNDNSTLSNTPLVLPSLSRAEKLQQKASKVGFDWPEPTEVIEKIEEKISELRLELKTKTAHDRLAAKLGDILFTQVNLARQLGVDPEAALRHANSKFERRFRMLEAELISHGSSPKEASGDELAELWSHIKQHEDTA